MADESFANLIFKGTEVNPNETDAKGENYETFHHKSSFWKPFLLVLCHTYLGVIDWSLVAMMFASVYWHLLNVHNLGFDVQTLIGCFLAFLIIPSLVFIPPLFRFASTPFGCFTFRIITIVFLALGAQVHETVRTVFIAFAVAMTFSRFYTSYSSTTERIGFSGGLFFLVVIRYCCISFHPLDFPENLSLFVLMLLASFVAIFYIKSHTSISQEEMTSIERRVNRMFHSKSSLTNINNSQDIHADKLESDTANNNNKNNNDEQEHHHLPSHLGPHSSRKTNDLFGMYSLWAIPKWMRICCGIFGSLLFAVSLIIGCYTLTSDSLIPRWSGYDPVTNGPIVTFCLGLGWLIQIILSTTPHASVYNFITHVVVGLFMLVGSLLFGFVRVNSGFGTALGGSSVVEIISATEFSLAVFIGGCFIALTFPTFIDVGLGMTQAYINRSSNRCKAVWIPIVVGLWMIIGFLCQLAWFAGWMVPLFGHAFWSNARDVFLLNATPAIICFFILISLRFHYLKKGSPEAVMDELIPLSLRDISPRKQKALLRNGSILSIIAIFVVVFLPGVRLRTWLYIQRGSRAIGEDFTVATFNVQMGYSFYNSHNLGFPSSNRLDDVGDVSPNVWGLQESDSVNMLHMNRDVVTYLADTSRYHPYYGFPSYAASPGVSLLSTELLQDVITTKLPREGEPLNRLLIQGYYNWRLSPGDEPKAVINVASTHISAFSEEARTTQLKVIAEWARSHSRGPLLLMGDFNTSINNTEVLWKENGTDSSTSDSLKVVTFSTDESRKEPGTETFQYTSIDHIYYRGLCLRRKGISSIAGVSDHLPVWASFSLPNKDGNCEVM